MTDAAARAAYIALALTPGVTAGRMKALITACETPTGALAAPFAFLCSIPGISRACATAVKQADPADGEQITHRVARLGGLVIVPGDPQFPAMLAEIPEPPLLLFALGNLSVLDAPAVAIVGSRHHSPYGAEVCRRVARAAAGAGIAVVSGMARGLDAVAHTAALDAGGTTIGVLGNGLGVVYPAANRELYERAASGGLLLTEFPPGERPTVWSFPRRNRLISGLARATVVVEAAEGSGALITGEAALEQGREVLAVPGQITSPTSTGTNRLIRDGATPLLDMSDLLGLYPGHHPELPSGGEGSGSLVNRAETGAEGNIASEPTTERESLVLGAMHAQPRLPDEISEAVGLGVSDVLVELFGLELLGLVVQEPGGRFRRA